MFQLTGVLGASALLAGCARGGDTGSQSDAAAGKMELKGYDPSGSIQITQTFAPRLDSLDGKTIAFVSDDSWEYERTFATIEKAIGEKYPTATIIGYDNFTHGIDAITKADNGLAEAMQEKKSIPSSLATPVEAAAELRAAVLPHRSRWLAFRQSL